MPPRMVLVLVSSSQGCSSSGLGCSPLWFGGSLQDGVQLVCALPSPPSATSVPHRPCAVSPVYSQHNKAVWGQVAPVLGGQRGAQGE